MPNYDVQVPAAVPQQWNLQVGPIGPAAAMPPAQLILHGPAQAVAMGASANVALNPGCTALYTNNLTDCSAFCLLYRPAGAAWNRASLIHMMGGPDPNSVNWAAMSANMPNAPGSVTFAILANSNPTVLTAGFLAAIAANLPNIPAANTWVYNNQVMAINFGVDWGAFAGQP